WPRGRARRPGPGGAPRGGGRGGGVGGPPGDVGGRRRGRDRAAGRAPPATDAERGAGSLVLVIDTSSVRSAVAVLEDRLVVGEEVWESGRDENLGLRVAALADPGELTAVAVALGPGSFTGLRLGVSFGLGLAMGRGIPFLGLGTLEIQAARAPVQAVGLADAGRGRVYWLGTDGTVGHGEPG